MLGGLILVLMTGTFFMWPRGTLVPAGQVPGKYWHLRTPEDSGMDSARLTWLSKSLRGSGCVVRGGEMVHFWGQPQVRSNVWSASKPVIVHAVFHAIQQGKIASLDAPATASEPRLGDLNPALNFKDRRITWRHLISQTSAYGVQEEPGTVFDYSDFQLALLSDTLFEKVYRVEGSAVDRDVMQPALYSALQMQDSPYLGIYRQNKAIGRLNISPRDFCRFGLLYLNKGNWNGKPLLDASWVQIAWHSALPATFPRTAGVSAPMIEGQRSMGGGSNQEDAWGSYSNTWWTNGANASGERLWPDAPVDTVGAFGQGGKWALVVIPSLDLVASWVESSLPFTSMTGQGSGHTGLNKILTRLAKCVKTRR